MIKKVKDFICSSKIKYLMIFIIFMFGAVITYNVIAEEKQEVVKVTGNAGAYAALYSTGEIYTWGHFMKNNIIENANAKDFVLLDHYNITYVNKDNELHRFDSGYVEDCKYKKLASNVKTLYEFDDEVAFFLTNDNKLYAVESGHQTTSKIISSYEKVDEIFFIMDNIKDVKTFNSYILIRDNNDVLYALGVNYFGKKINEGNYLSTVTKILDNVKSYDSCYALDNNNDLYLFSNLFAKPTIMRNNIKEVDSIYDSDFSDIYEKIALTDMNNKKYYIEYSISEEGITINNEYEIDKKINDIYFYYHSEEEFYLIENTLYHRERYYDQDDSTYKYKNTMMLENVKKFKDGKILTEDGTFYILERLEYFGGLEKVNEIKINDYVYKITEGVKNFYLGTNNNGVVFLIMENDTIMAFGYNTEYNNLFNDKTIITTGIPAVISGLPNVEDKISVYDIELSTGNKTKFTEGDKVDYYVNIFPYNAVDKSVVWESSNEDVATVNNEGLITTKGVGTTTITVKTSDGRISRSQEINVYPKVNSIEITNGDSLDLEIYEKVVLTANVKPDDTLEKDIVWTVSDKNNVGVSEGDYWLDGETIKLESNQIAISVYAGGTYTVTATTKNGLYSDSITINTVEKVNGIELDINDDNYDGVNNIFIFLSESSTLDIGYKIYPTTATNQNVTWKSSNKDVATVDSTGKITAYKEGRTKITISSVDGGATRTFNVLVYDYSSNDNVIIGDVNGDKEVNILDLIKLRRYLAGLEDSLQ